MQYLINFCFSIVCFYSRNERVTGDHSKDGSGTKPDGSRLASASSSPPAASGSNSMDQADQRAHRPLAFEKVNIANVNVSFFLSMHPF